MREQQVGRVCAGNQQDEEHRAQQDEEGTACRPYQLIVQREHPQLSLNAERIGMGLGDARTDSLHLCTRDLDCGAALQAGNDVEQLNRATASGRHVQRLIHIDVACAKACRKRAGKIEPEGFRQYSDDRHLPIVERDRPADGG